MNLRTHDNTSVVDDEFEGIVSHTRLFTAKCSVETDKGAIATEFPIYAYDMAEAVRKLADRLQPVADSCGNLQIRLTVKK